MSLESLKENKLIPSSVASILVLKFLTKADILKVKLKLRDDKIKGLKLKCLGLMILSTAREHAMSRGISEAYIHSQ
jgi:hypothetical protein